MFAGTLTGATPRARAIKHDVFQPHYLEQPWVDNKSITKGLFLNQFVDTRNSVTNNRLLARNTLGSAEQLAGFMVSATLVARHDIPKQAISSVVGTKYPTPTVFPALMAVIAHNEVVLTCNASVQTRTKCVCKVPSYGITHKILVAMNALSPNVARVVFEFMTIYLAFFSVIRTIPWSSRFPVCMKVWRCTFRPLNCQALLNRMVKNG